MNKIIACTLGILAGVYFLVSNRQVKETRYTIRCKKIPKEFDGKKILLISDLHKKRYGDKFDNLINSVEFCKPDYIFFGGDLYSKDEKDMKPKVFLMQRLLKIAPVYYVLGNHETHNMDNCEALCTKLSQMGVEILRNARTRIYLGNSFINIYGTQLPQSCYLNRQGGYSNLREISPVWLEKYLGKTDKNQCNILISHNPFFFKSYARWGADLVFSGHCHGGCVRLPLIGGLFSPERKFFPEYSKGVYKEGNSQMILTAGLGKFRLNNPSEIVLCTLKCK